MSRVPWSESCTSFTMVLSCLPGWFFKPLAVAPYVALKLAPRGKIGFKEFIGITSYPCACSALQPPKDNLQHPCAAHGKVEKKRSHSTRNAA